MAKKKVAQETLYEIAVTASELETICTGLRLIRDFGLFEDWDQAQDVLADLSKED